MGSAASTSPEQEHSEKTSYFMVPESPWDHLEEWDQKTLPFEPFRVSSADLLVAASLPLGNPTRLSIGKDLIAAIKNHQIFIIKMSTEEESLSNQLTDQMKEFFAKSDEEKKQRRIKAPSGRGTIGFIKLFFDNRDNIRDPEYRDVFQIRLGEDVPHDVDYWWPSQKFKEIAEKYFDTQWNISMSIIQLLVEQLGIPFEKFARLVDSDFQSGGKVSYNENPDTNLSLFCYTDTQNYQTTQRCMVHQDHGFITLLPKSTFPGIQLLHDEKWISMEEHTSQGETIVYLGLAAELFCEQSLPVARHRVVRQPGQIRYSLPFEVKSNIDAEIVKQVTTDSFEKQLTWERIQSSVHRVDAVVI